MAGFGIFYNYEIFFCDYFIKLIWIQEKVYSIFDSFFRREQQPIHTSLFFNPHTL